MSFQDETEKSPVDVMLSEIRKNMFPEGAMSTAWVLATEWIDVNGDYFSLTLTDGKAPPWHHVGLLSKSQIELDEFLIEENEED